MVPSDELPRWSTPGGPVGTAEHDGGPDPRLAAAVHTATGNVDATTVLLTAQAKVLSTLTGEPEVLLGCVRSRLVQTYRLTVHPGSWAELLADVRRVEERFPWHRTPTGPAEVVVEVADRDDDDGVPDLGDSCLWLRFGPGSGRLRAWYRTDVLNADHAARIVEYHRTALELVTGGSGSDHSAHSLLSAAEQDLQLAGLAGPRRELPDARFHELFEDRVRQHPDAVAVTRGAQHWTYAELNRRANRIAHGLLSRGLAAEDVVAVVTERSLDWMASVLAIFKAGGAYLPIEPHFPTDRISRTLSRAGARMVLTEPRSARHLPAAGGHVLLIEDLYREGRRDIDPGVPVAAGQLAYVYFTSGSTGEPKGAMCEHAGMLNHLYAKIDDLELDEGRTVAQTAPQCFDISLWQLVASLLVGGRTLIVEQDVVLDVERFVATVAEGEVDVLQLVPSYLEMLLSHLDEHPHELPRLRCVSATGEALKAGLVARWFAMYPEKALVNAYGLTETSDDTNHEVMREPPERGRVPLGRAVNNVRVYVVDEMLRPVPLGSPGEIVFSGVCVGRGYVNDPERTRLSFLEDPHRPGERLYRSGDFGRWLPDGRLEFLGRRDSQVKIRGFRIEIGEIENRLLRVPGVRDGAVVVVDSAPAGRSLAAFCTASTAVAAGTVTSALARSLPEYMVPTALHVLESLPTTDNGKIDKRALVTLAAELAATGPGHEPPRTPTETRLAKAWAHVLNLSLDQVGRTDHFFDRGGTSLSAVRMVVALDRELSLPDIGKNPVLVDLATVLDARRAIRGTTVP